MDVDTLPDDITNDDEQSVKNLQEEFENADGFFRQVVVPMLQKGHEGELCEWLKDLGLLQKSMRCPTETCMSQSMDWAPARVVDKYQWVCSSCSHRVSIREKSFFKGLKCSVPNTLRVLQAWCDQYDIVEIAEALDSLGLKSYIIRRVYEYCDTVVSRNMMLSMGLVRMGAPGAVVVLEVLHLDNKRSNPAVACLADTRYMPPQFWYHLISGSAAPTTSAETNNNDAQNSNNNTPKKNALKKKSNRKQNVKNPKSQKLELKVDVNQDEVSNKMDISDTENQENMNRNNILTDEKEIKAVQAANVTPNAAAIKSLKNSCIVQELHDLVNRKVALGCSLVLGKSVTADAVKKISKIEGIIVVPVKKLEKKDTERNSIVNNIDTIFNIAHNVVAQSRGVARCNLQDFFMRELWLDKYASNGDSTPALETLLHHINEDPYCNEFGGINQD